jgi:hypothetical protein
MCSHLIQAKRVKLTVSDILSVMKCDIFRSVSQILSWVEGGKVLAIEYIHYQDSYAD